MTSSVETGHKLRGESPSCSGAYPNEIPPSTYRIVKNSQDLPCRSCRIIGHQYTPPYLSDPISDRFMLALKQISASTGLLFSIGCHWPGTFIKGHDPLLVAFIHSIPNSTVAKACKFCISWWQGEILACSNAVVVKEQVTCRNARQSIVLQYVFWLQLDLCDDTPFASQCFDCLLSTF